MPILILLLPMVIFSAVDHRVWTWDEAFYGAGSLKILIAFRQSFGTGVNEFFNVLGTKAPFISWIGFVYCGILGSFMRFELTFMVAQTSFLFFLCYFFSKIFYEDKISYLRFIGASLGVLAVPHLQILSHFYFVEIMQAFSVFLFLDLYITRSSIEINELFWRLIFYSIFLFAIKISSPVYIFVFALSILNHLLRHRQQINFRIPRTWSKSLFWGIVSFSVITIIWYIINFSIILDFAKSAASGPIAALYGTNQPFIVKLDYWYGWIKRLFFYDETRLLLFSLLSLTIVFQIKKIIKNSIFWIVFLQFNVTIVIFSTQVNQETRYLFPLVSLFVFLILQVVTLSRISFFIFSIIAIYQYVYFIGVSFDFWPQKRDLPYFDMIKSTGKTRENELSLVKKLCAGKEKKVIVIGVDTITLNADVMRFYSLSNGISENNCLMIAHGHAETNVDTSLRLIEKLNARYVVFSSDFDMKSTNDPFNRISVSLLQKLKEQGWTPSFPHPETQILSPPSLLPKG